MFFSNFLQMAFIFKREGPESLSASMDDSGFFVFGTLFLLEVEIELRLPLGRVAGLIAGQGR